ncbi:MAG TPA: hypothetical protein VGC61_05765 [Pyrinomonadaceae bacterium]
MKFEKADERIDGGHAFRAMAAYAKWLEDCSDEARRELAILRCLGLFDRPADAGCISALRREPAIDGLTESLVGLDDADWNLALSSLTDCGLISFASDQSVIGSWQSAIDSHPHIREYFAKQLRETNPDAWRAAHRRLYEHLCANTDEGDQPTLEDLQPLYQAVAHGCQAGLQQEACEKVFFKRVRRRNEDYPTRKLGAFASELACAACFFEQPWSRIFPAVTEMWQAWLLAVAAFDLRALGRLAEVRELIQAGRPIEIRRKDWTNASISGNNLSELELTLGDVDMAVGDAEQSVTYADRSGDALMREVTRSIHADTLYQAGRLDEAATRFREAEEIHAKARPETPLLYSIRRFRYCGLLLAAPERAAWREGSGQKAMGSGLKADGKVQKSDSVEICRNVAERAVQTLGWAEQHLSFLDIALDHLTLGCAALYAAILADSTLETPNSELVQAMDGLRRASAQEFIARGLLTRAWLRFLTGACTGSESAQEDLDEAWEIAERGPMKLFMADIHLYRARLFGGMKDEGGRMKYPWDKNPDGSSRGPKDDLDAAERLINQCGYHRRDEELADARKAVNRES